MQNNNIGGNHNVPIFHNYLPKYKNSSIPGTGMSGMLNFNRLRGAVVLTCGLDLGGDELVTLAVDVDNLD